MTQNNLYYEKGGKNPLNLEPKIGIFQLCSSEPKYGHILAEEPKMKKTKAFYFQKFQFQIFPKLSPREVYKNLEKVSVLVSILRLMAVSV